ncbi:MAG: aldehyde ferredoxin oxidoreductase N-terminal domain-containing protein [Clostridiaceae bacterium]|nr:aldehyde ferredoxin oxidoreductase N-terminal domain-containing protein [Clostridiaceae bacterium]
MGTVIKCDPLGQDNKLIVCPGLLTGTMAPCSGRISIGGKSPLTGTIKEANAGGIVAQMLVKLDLKAIVIEGKPTEVGWHILLLKNDAAMLLPADEYAGMNNYELTEKLGKIYGDHIGIASIGGGTGVTYATSPMSADHTAGNALGNPTVDPYRKEGQVELSTNLQVGMIVINGKIIKDNNIIIKGGDVIKIFSHLLQGG